MTGQRGDLFRRRTFAVGAALVAVAVVVTRFQARQRTFWEWDDFLFGRALHHFAPLEGVPQAPFYPGFVLLGRLTRLFVANDTAALTMLSAIASAVAVAAVFGITRELLGSRRIALAASALFAFFPAVWFHAGSPLSDDAGLAAALGALWGSLAARRRPGILPWAIVLFAAAVSIRPQDAIVAVPALAVALRRRPVATAVAVAAPALAWGAPVAWAARGLGNALTLFRRQAAYVLSTDSIAGPTRSLSGAVLRYGVQIWVRREIALVVIGLAIIGLAVLIVAGRRGELAVLGVSFVPYAAIALFLLDPTVAGRYVMPALPALAILIGVAATSVERRLLGGFPFVAASVMAAGIRVTAPSITVLHTRPAPPVEAAERLRAEARRPFALDYSLGLTPHVEALLPDVPRFPEETTSPSVLSGVAVPVWRYGVSAFESETAAWPPLSPFWTVGRGRYLSVPFGPWSPLPAFGRGWYAEEIDGTERFRWMGREGEIVLPPCAPPARLLFSLVAPFRPLGGHPTVEARLNGRLIDRRTLLSERTEVLYRFRDGLSATADNVLRLSTDRVIGPRRAGTNARDARELGLQLRPLRWKAGPVPAAAAR